MDIIKELREVINTLDSLSIPVKLTESVTIPLVNASAQLKRLHNAIYEEQHASAQEPEISIEPIEEPEEEN